LGDISNLGLHHDPRFGFSTAQTIYRDELGYLWKYSDVNPSH